MTFQPGERIHVGDRVAYVIVGEGRRVSRHVAFPGRKVLWNTRWSEGRVELVEADEDEWLDVTIRPPGEDSDVRALRFEAACVLGLPGAFGLPEPVDLIEHPAGPLLVLSASPGRSLAARRPPDLVLQRFLDELRGLIDLF